MNTYEGLLIFQDALKDDALEASLKDVKEEIEKLEGRVDQTVRMGRRSFARVQSDKYKGGHYVVMGFVLKPANVSALLLRLKLKEEVFRSQIIRQDAQPPVAQEAKEAEHGVTK